MISFMPIKLTTIVHKLVTYLERYVIQIIQMFFIAPMKDSIPQILLFHSTQLFWLTNSTNSSLDNKCMLMIIE